MQPTRRARLESVIREELTLLISRELKDPRVPSLVITGVTVTQDGGNATISISLFDISPLSLADAVPGERREPLTPAQEAQQAQEEKARRERVRLCLEGLRAASGFLRRKLSAALNVRTIPELTFKEDRGLSNTLRVHELLKQIASNSNSDPQGGSTPA